ncbi:MAG: hypothetical protein IJE07_07880, partial [Clostridia bacterium]|nr:hypothetical protein [Clostridia bacterium]
MKRTIRVLGMVVVMMMLFCIIPATVMAESGMKDGFTLVLNPDGATSIVAGQQGEYPVYALEDMAAKENAVTVNGEAAYTVQGSNNPKAAGENAKGVIPDTGAAMYF